MCTPLGACRLALKRPLPSAGQCGNPKIRQDNHAQDDPVVSEKFEVMAAHIAHEEADGVDRHAKGHRHPQENVENLGAI